MFKTIKQLEQSTLPEDLKQFVRNEFRKIMAPVDQLDLLYRPKPKNKWHNKHVYVCAACDTILSVVDLKKKIFHCTQCGETKDYLFFPSKKEGAYYFKLLMLKRTGYVTYFVRQVRYPIFLDTGEKIVYVLDYLVKYPDGHTEYIDVKGKRLPEYVIKKKLVEERWGISIKEV